MFSYFYRESYFAVICTYRDSLTGLMWELRRDTWRQSLHWVQVVS